jgi:A/G-specific adenine glycosylase
LDENETARLLAQQGVTAVKIKKSARKKHIFTHIEWNMSSYVIDCENEPDAYVWVTRDRLISDIALPSAFRSFLDMI